MANRYWDGGTSADPTDVNNWSDTDGGGTPASSVPGTGDVANFTANGDGNVCTATANWALGGLVFLVGYTSKFDLVTYNLTMDSGANVTLDGGGEFDCGMGTISITNGAWDVIDQSTVTKGSSTVLFTGTCTIDSGTSNDFHHLTVVSGTTTVENNNVEMHGTLTLNGILSVNTGLTFYQGTINTAIVNSGGSMTGSGTARWYFQVPGLGEGVTTFNADSTIDIPVIIFDRPDVASILRPGNYQSAVKILNSSNTTDYTLALDTAGAYTFSSLELETTGSNALTLANNTNGPASITITGDLTIDSDANGAIAIDDSGQLVAWVIQGDILDEQSSDFTWTKGIGSVTLSGTANQACDFMDQDPGQLIIDKGTSGTVDIEAGACELGAVTMVDNLTFTNSTMTASADAKSVTGNVSFADAGNDIDLGAGAWSITGDLDLSNVGTWNGGTSVITASGGSAQAWDLDGKTVTEIIVDKTAGTLTWSAAATMTTFTGTDTGTGDFDPNGQTITITGDCSWAAAFDMNSAADTMDGSTWIVGGNFTADGQTLNATAAWYLQVTGTAFASGLGEVEYSDANGTNTVIHSFRWTDGGNNTNWNFSGISNFQLGGRFGEEEHVILRPNKNVKILV